MQKQKDTTLTEMDQQQLAARSSKEEIKEHVACIQQLYQQGRLKFPSCNCILILDKNRQIVFANDNFFRLVGNPKKHLLYGKRPGEALQCQNACKTEGGCGTSDACMECGALLSILSSLQGHAMESECRIIQKDTNKAFDFAVHTFPLEAMDKTYVVMLAKDISHVKRREVLEKVFLHDLLNIAAGIQGLASMLKDLPEKAREKAIDNLQQISTELVEEIQGQRQLLYAETGNLRPIIADTTTGAIINRQLMLYENHSVTKKRRLVVLPETVDKPIRTDASLLGRVIGNMIKNALEASKREGTVSILCRELDDNFFEFSVHNATYIRKRDQRQIFQRSFTTKGKGRGIGTYCIKLLTENYLQGRVYFESSRDKGTTFYVRVPKSLSESNTQSENRKSA